MMLVTAAIFSSPGQDMTLLDLCSLQAVQAPSFFCIIFFVVTEVGGWLSAGSIFLPSSPSSLIFSPHRFLCGHRSRSVVFCYASRRSLLLVFRLLEFSTEDMCGLVPILTIMPKF